MSELQAHIVGTDSTYIFPIETENHETQNKQATDLTGAYIYFQIFDALGNLILDKNNDPAGTNVGITIRAPATGGVVEIKIEHEDLVGESGTLCYALLVRLDPLGADDRSEKTGTIEVTAGKAVVGAPPFVPGAAAYQNQQQRSFKWTVPSTGTSWTVTIPTTGMLDAVYCIGYSYSFIPAAGVSTPLYFPEASRTAADFLLESNVDLEIGTILDIILRDA